MQYNNKLAKFLKKERLKTKKSLNVFAVENEIEPSTLSRVENGLLEIKMGILVKIALGLDTTPAELLADFEETLLKKN